MKETDMTYAPFKTGLHDICQEPTICKPMAREFSKMLMIMTTILILIYYLLESGFNQRNRTSRRDILRDLLQGTGLHNCRSWLGNHEIHR